MIGLGPHAVYIVFAYLGVLAVTLGLVGLTAADSRRQKARLKALEAAGVRRRSDRKNGQDT